MEKLNENESPTEGDFVRIKRCYVCTIRDIFTMKGVSDYRIIRMTGEDGLELKPFEPMSGRPLGRKDAIVISPFTESEIQELIKASTTDEELEAFQSSRTKEGIRHYNIHYFPDDPICAETIDYFLPDGVDTSSAFIHDSHDIIREAILDNSRGISKWICDTKEDYLEFRAIDSNYIGSGIIRNTAMIREMKTKDVVVILARNEPEHSDDLDFVLLTAYPDITERALTAVPTGRDIRADLHETNAYKQADEAEKRLLDQKVLRGLTH